MASEPFMLRWGVLATGKIAKTFAKDLLVSPSTRGVTDIHHEIVAAASSTSQERASSFLSSIGAPPSAKPYGSYADLVADPNIDIIYIATPHSHHYQNARLCLEAGKHVLCEKAFTVNAEQARVLVELARKKNLFLMEAVWTRFFPLAREVRSVVESGKLGEVTRVMADLSFAIDVEKELGNESRMVNLALAGGALLDLGIYSLTWVYQILYHIAPESHRGDPVVHSQITKYTATGCDETTTILLKFPSGAHAIAMTSIRVPTTPPGIIIQGTQGTLTIPHPCYRPTAYTLKPHTPGPNPVKVEPQTKTFEITGGYGMFYEADECARCIRDGKTESEGLPLEESLSIMRVMDQVREQGDLVYPQDLESIEYPLEF